MAEATSAAHTESLRAFRRYALTLTPAQATVAVALIGALSAWAGSFITQRTERDKAQAQIHVVEMQAKTTLEGEMMQAKAKYDLLKETYDLEINKLNAVKRAELEVT